MHNEKEIHIIFNPGKGEVGLRSITAVVGDRVGAMPKATRRGYSFAGWYTYPEGAGAPSDGHDGRITAEDTVDERFDDDIILYAHWQKVSKKAKKMPALNSLKKPITALIIAAVVLVAALIFVNYIVDIYTFVDEDGVEYTIKKNKGVYALYYDGSICDVNDEGYYQTNLGTLVDVDGETGEYEIYAVVDTDGTEELGFSRRVLMFKQLTYDMSSTKDLSKVIEKIEISNEHGEIVFNRGENNRFVIEGFESTLFSDETFAALANGCGYTISTQRLESPVRLEDGSIDLSEYGLVAETRTRIEYPEGEESKDTENDIDIPTHGDREDGVEVEYEYVPAKYTVTTMTGDKYTVILGDATVSGASYYAMYEGRDTVYILSGANLEKGALAPIESIVTPMIAYPTSMNNYFNVEDFTYRSDIDYTAIYMELFEKVLDIDRDTLLDLSEEELEEYQARYDEAIEKMDDEEYGKIYDEAFINNSNLITKFSFIPNDERENILDSKIPYKMSSDYMKGYFPNSDNIGQVLQLLYSMTFVEVIKLAPTDEDLIEYGLDEAAHVIKYTFLEETKEANGDTKVNKIFNHIEISEKKDGIYYAYSPNYDMIVAVSESQMPYLEWDDIDWYQREYFNASILHLNSIKLESPSFSVNFELDNSASLRDENGNIDEEAVKAGNDDKLKIYADGKLVDYNIMMTRPSGKTKLEHSNYNFKRFYTALMTASLEGTCELSEEEMAALRATPESECRIKLTISIDDGDYITKDENGNPTREKNSRCLVIRCYQYTERKAYLTIEELDSPDSPSNPENAQGKFYVLSSFCDKLVADAQRYLNEVEINASSKN